MTKKQITIVLDGNSRKMESAFHELSKFCDEANAEPELSASIQSEMLDDETSEQLEFTNEHSE